MNHSSPSPSSFSDVRGGGEGSIDRAVARPIECAGLGPTMASQDARVVTDGFVRGGYAAGKDKNACSLMR